MRTLVLDQGYQPHRVVDWRRAVTMLFDGKVEVLEEYDEAIWKSATVVMRMPAVVRLLRRVRGKRSIKFSRINVAMRDDFACQYCGRRLPLKQLTYDHVVPRSKGGADDWSNVTVLCRRCNSAKGSGPGF